MKKTLLLSLFLFAGIRLNAQFFQLNLPFVWESMQPEMFVFEPHYDSQNKLTYYALGNLLKVSYTWNEKQLPVSKTLYMWNVLDYDWKTTSQTSYTYDPAGQLTEERTTQLCPVLYNAQLSYIKTTLALKQISRSADARTDTIREYVYTPKMRGGHSNNSDMRCSVRYLNREGMPDSVVFKKESSEMIYGVKNQYTYDHEKRAVRIEASYFHQNKSWKPFYTVHIKYGKDQITYTYTPHLKPEKEELSALDPEKQQYELLKYQDLTFTLTFDKQNRITSKHLKRGETVLLDAAYRYDSYGNTLVNHKQHLENDLLYIPNYPSEIMQGRWNHVEYTVDYDKENRSHLVYCTNNADNKLIRMAEMWSSYSPDGLLLSCDLQKYDEDNGSFDERERKVTTYTKNGLEGESLFYRISDSNEINHLLDHPVKKIVFKKNEAGQILYEEKYAYDHSTKQWKPDKKRRYEYDTNGYEKHKEEYIYNDEEHSWVGECCNEYTRDDLNRIYSEERKNWNLDTQKWENEVHYRYEYDTYHNKTLEEKYSWNLDKAYWIGISRDSTLYDKEGKAKLEISYIWLDDKKEWQPDQRVEYKKDSVTDESIYFEWEGNRWQPVKKYFEYTTRTPHTTNYSISSGESAWYQTKNDWEIVYLEKETHLDSIYTDERYYWNSKTGELEGYKHINTERTNSESEQRIQTSYSLWDRVHKNWKKAARHTHLHDDSSDTYILETYDPVLEKLTYERKVIKCSVNDTTKCVNQYLWDHSKNTWTDHSRQLFYYWSSDFTSPHRFNGDQFDPVSGTWKPKYSGEEVFVSGNQKYTCYHKWDKTTDNWLPYYMKQQDGWLSSEYLWNSKADDWEVADTWINTVYERVKSIREELLSYFSSDYETFDYEALKEKKQNE